LNWIYLRTDLCLRKNKHVCHNFFRLFDNLEPLFYPMVWFETYTELDDETATLMKFLGIAPKLGDIIGSLMVVIGAIVFALSMGSVWRSSRGSDAEKYKKHKKRYV
jgi:hypothetical protein